MRWALRREQLLGRSLGSMLEKDAQSCADFMYQEVGTYPLVQKTGPINCYNEHILILVGLTCIHDCFISNVLRFCPFEL